MIDDWFILEHVVMRIETKQAPIPSQPEVVLSDGKQNLFIFFFGLVWCANFK